jgi:hypothetical protein
MKKILVAAITGLFVVSSLVAAIVHKAVVRQNDNLIRQIFKDTLPHQPNDTSRNPMQMPDTTRMPKLAVRQLSNIFLRLNPHKA